MDCPLGSACLTIRQYARCVLLWALFVASRAVIFAYLAGINSDLGTQKAYVGMAVAGRVPFRDFFLEYPPLVFLYSGIPAIFDQSLQSYLATFRVLSCAVDCGIFALVLRTTKGSASQCLLYIVGTTVLGSIIYDRIDIVLGAMLVAAVVSLLYGRDNLFKLAIGTGIAFKLIPVIFLPMILAREWKKVDRRLFRACSLLALPMLLSFDVLMLLGARNFDKLFEYHARRPIQLESGPASAAMILMMFGAPGHVTGGYGSWNLAAPYGTWLVMGAALLLAAVCAGSAVMVLRRRSRWHGQETVPQQGDASFVLLMAAVLAAAMALSKVLSPQYFLFLLPVLVLLPVPRDRSAAIANWLLIAAIYILTGLIFPWWYSDLVALKPAAEFVLIARNELLVVLAISLAYRAWSGFSAADAADIGKLETPAAIPAEVQRSPNSTAWAKGTVPILFHGLHKMGAVPGG